MIRKLSESIKSINTIVSSNLTGDGCARRSNKLISGQFTNRGMLKFGGIASGLILACTCISAMQAGWKNTSDIVGLTQSSSVNSQNIGSHIGALSLAMNNEYQRSDIVFISQFDDQLAHVISNADDTISPKYREPSASDIDNYMIYNGIKVLNVFSDNDINKHYSYAILNGDFYGQHALSIYEDQENLSGRKFCYIRSYHKSAFRGQLSSPIFFSPNEARIIIKHHEQGHCLDRREAHTELESEDEGLNHTVLQAEIIADVYAGLRSIAITGNTDTIRYTLLPFRTMPNHDNEHQSSLVLQKLLDMELDVEQITRSTPSELWEQTMRLIQSEFDYTDMAKEREAYFHAEKMFAEATSLILSEDNQAGEAQEPKNQAIALDYGLNLYETMLNHYVYHNKLDDEKALTSLIAAAKKIDALSDLDLSAQIKALEERIENKEPISHNELADLIGVKISANSKAFEANDALFEKEHEKFVDEVQEIDKKLEDNSYQRPKFLFEYKTERSPEQVLEKQLSSAQISAGY